MPCTTAPVSGRSPEFVVAGHAHQHGQVTVPEGMYALPVLVIQRGVQAQVLELIPGKGAVGRAGVVGGRQEPDAFVGAAQQGIAAQEIPVRGMRAGGGVAGSAARATVQPRSARCASRRSWMLCCMRAPRWLRARKGRGTPCYQACDGLVVALRWPSLRSSPARLHRRQSDQPADAFSGVLQRRHDLITNAFPGRFLHAGGDADGQHARAVPGTGTATET